MALREIQQTQCILFCCSVSRASRRGPKSLQHRSERLLGRRREKKLYENRPPKAAKSARWRSKMACEGPPDGFSMPVGPNLDAKAARKPSLGGSGGALGTLLALLEPSWSLLGCSWGVPGRSWAPLGGRFGPSRGLIWTIWTMSVALREIQQKPLYFTVFFGF